VDEAEWIAFLQRPEIPAFNRAMLDNPDDDLPRMVFADWLDENCPDADVNRVVRESISGEQKVASWPRLQGNREWYLAFTRGRIFAWINVVVRLSRRRQPQRMLEAVWRSEWVETVLFGNVRGHVVDSCIHTRGMWGVRSLGLTGIGLQAASLIRWLSPELTPRLTGLGIYRPCLDAGWLQALATSPNVARLTTLTLTACQIGDEGVFVLASSPHLANLRHLHLEAETVSPAAAILLANSPYLWEGIREQWRPRPDEVWAHR
jgi:uncharacterized protein (TIGR02996 family)